MTLLLDMNLSPPWVEFLAAEGFEAMHIAGNAVHLNADLTVAP